MRLTLYATVFIMLMSGCAARIPEPVGYEYSTQQKLQAMYHWEVLAFDVANQINNELIRQDYINTPVFVKSTCGSEAEICKPNQTPPFNESFRDLLVTELVKLGVPTSNTINEETITVNYKSQLVYHSRNRLRTVKPGVITLVTGGIMVLRNTPTEIFAIGLAGMADLANTNAVRSSNHEVMITTSIVDRERYVFRQSDIYYINDVDFWHYFTDETEAGEIEMTSTYFSKTSKAAAPAKEMMQEMKDEVVIEPAPKIILPDPAEQGTDI